MTRPWNWLSNLNASAVNSVAPLSQLIQTLCDSDIDFIVVGGFAALLHGGTLVTRDLDVCAVLSNEDVEKLRAALHEFHPTHRLTPQRLSFLGNPEPGVPVKNLYLETDLGAVDLLSFIQGVGDFARVRANSIEVDLFGRRCRVISLDDLIRAKEAVGREKDLLSVKELKAIREKQGKS
jgi:hypothetical protein